MEALEGSELEAFEAECWERNAGWWQEGFTDGADPEYAEQILPLVAEHLAGAKRVLDLGCGEGQVGRAAAALPGVEVVIGVDPTWAQLTQAAGRGGGVSVARAEAGGLPFPPGSFDTVVACLVFEHIVDLEATVAEVSRVLGPAGTVVVFLNHPLLQVPGSGWIDDTILEEQYWRVGPYLVEDHRLEEVDKGVWIPFVHRPLSRYVKAFAAHGLYLTAMEEPAPPPGFLDKAAEYREAATIPRLLVLRAERMARQR
ncbi:MAG: class I SAM-dependent methyltransferase [Acidimicrobiales bacterium]